MKILVVKTSSLGDITHALPALKSLKGHHVDWVVEKRCRAVLEKEEGIRALLIVDTQVWKRWWSLQAWRAFFSFKQMLQKERYDWVVDLQGNCKSGVITFLARAKKKVGLGKKSAMEWPNALVTDIQVDPPSGVNVREESTCLLKPLGIQPVAMDALQGPEKKEKVWVGACSRWPNKMVKSETLGRFLRQWEEKGVQQWILSCGSVTERLYVEQVAAFLSQPVEIADSWSLEKIRQQLSQCDFFIGVDSFLLHWADWLGVPTLGIFGPSSAQKYAPPRGKWVEGPCPYGITFERRCPQLRRCPTGACLKELKTFCEKGQADRKFGNG